MRLMTERYLLALGLAGFGLAVQAAEPRAATGGKATLTVEYNYESIGKQQDQVELRQWQARRSVKLVAFLVAKAPTSLPTMQALDAKQKADLKNKEAKSKAAATKMAPMTQSVEAIMAKCGEDEACITREVQKMGAAMAGTPQMAAAMSAGKDIDEISKQGPMRYQAWAATTQSGTFAIDESLHIVHADPICMGRPKQRCTRDEVRKGAGSVPLPPGMKSGKGMGGMYVAEVDMARNTLTLSLPVPMMPLPYIETITTDEPEGTHDVPTPKGPQKRQLMFRTSSEEYGVSNPTMTVPLAGNWRNQSGQQVVMRKGALGEGGKLTIRWHLQVQ